MFTCPKLVNSKWLIVNSRLASGQVLILALFFLGIVLILSGALFAKLENYASYSSTAIEKAQAINIAEAGVDHALWELNTEIDTQGTFYQLNSGKYDFSWNTISNTTTITSTAYIPNETAPQITQKIQITAEFGDTGGTLPLDKAIQAGDGGVQMGTTEDTTATIIGNVFSNNKVHTFIATWLWSITGNMEIAAFFGGFPPYPEDQVCSHVQGIICDDGVLPKDLPVPEGMTEQSVKDNAASTGDIRSAILHTCNQVGNPPNSYTFGPTQINGELNLVNCQVTLKGDLYVTGNVTFSGSTVVSRDQAALGDQSVFIISDGKIRLDTEAEIFKDVGEDGYITLWSTVDSVTSGINAIEFDKGTGGALYAPGPCNPDCIDGSGGTVKFFGGLGTNNKTLSIAAYKIELDDTARVEYEDGLATPCYNPPCSSGSGGGWQFLRGTYQYIDD